MVLYDPNDRGKGDRPIYIDIDGTLTDHDLHGGNAIPERIAQVRGMIEDGVCVVIWSGTGTTYAIDFCQKHGLIPYMAIGKPEMCVDNDPTIRPRKRMPIIHPKDYF